MRKLLASFAFLLGVLFVINHYTQLESVVGVLKSGNWRFFTLALVVTLLWLLAYAATYASVFKALGTERGILPFVRLAAAANFVNIVAPSVGMSGLTVFVSDAHDKRYPSAHATVGHGLVVLFEYISFTFFLVLGLVVLLRRGSLDGPEIFASAFLWVSAILLALLLYLGLHSEEALARFLKLLSRIVNRLLRPFIKRDYLSEERAVSFAREASEGLKNLRARPQKLLPALFYSIVAKAMLLIVLLLMFFAFNVAISTGTIFAGFAIAYLFTIVSPTPAGIGVVEGLLTLSLVSMFVPLSAAAVIVLGYRALTFWLPLLLGMLAVQSLSLSSEQKISSDSSQHAKT